MKDESMSHKEFMEKLKPKRQKKKSIKIDKEYEE